MAELVAVVSVWQGVFFGHCSRDRRDVPVCCSRRALRGRTCPHRILPSPKNKCARKKEPARKHKTRRREGEGKKEKEQRGYDERSSEQRASRHCVRLPFVACPCLLSVDGPSSAGSSSSSSGVGRRAGLWRKRGLSAGEKEGCKRERERSREGKRHVTSAGPEVLCCTLRRQQPLFLSLLIWRRAKPDPRCRGSSQYCRLGRHGVIEDVWTGPVEDANGRCVLWDK